MAAVEALMPDRLLRTTATVFALALLVHGADHLRRGLELPSRLAIVGGLQFLVGMIAVALVLTGRRLGPAAAIAVGFPSALLFTYGHLVPVGTDPYVGADAAGDVTAFSWITAVFEIGADFAFGLAGALVLRRRGIASASPRALEHRGTLV
jgi:hypothetical protein